MIPAAGAVPYSYIVLDKPWWANNVRTRGHLGPEMRLKHSSSDHGIFVRPQRRHAHET